MKEVDDIGKEEKCALFGLIICTRLNNLCVFIFQYSRALFEYSMNLSITYVLTNCAGDQ